MKKGLKISFIVLVVMVGVVVLDTLQAKIFDNSPLLSIRENLDGGSTDYIDKGLLVNYYYCNNDEKTTTWKDEKFACPIKEDVGLGWTEDNIDYWIQDEEDISFIRGLFQNYSFTSETCDGINDYYLLVDGNAYGIEVYEKTVHITSPGKEIVLNELDSQHIIQVIQKWQENYPGREITLEDINDKIGNYLSNYSTQVPDYAYSYVDEEKQVVVVGLVENNQENQDDFIFKVFSNCCGSKYIQYIKNHSLIEFKTSKSVFDAEVVEIKDKRLTVKVLETYSAFKKGDIVIVGISNIVDDSYKSWKNIRITFNGLVNESNPPQIGAYKIESITY